MRKLFLSALALLLLPMSVFAHATVSPTSSRPGAYEKYVVRVPNESDNPTVSVSITFPDQVRVISFSDVPGWKLETVMDSTGRAISATWTGSLPPERFVEFPFVAVNPKSAASVAWPIRQTYANGTVVNWAGPRDSNNPASVTTIAGAGLAWDRWLPTVLAGLALVVASIALAVGSRAGRPVERAL